MLLSECEFDALSMAFCPAEDVVARAVSELSLLHTYMVVGKVKVKYSSPYYMP